MKNYLVFIGSFIILFLLLQLLSGAFLTTTFILDYSQATYNTENISEVVEFGNSSSILFYIIVILSATMAYFVPKVMTKFKR
ncbi:hypothetical protein [Cytobacillus sp. IB215665]|uniref:hypothetical protein n=1 Tax=Cytobacillus sp. IB215665 TaxID=3097357 RepID=UPI002A135AB2|nr:hypothetical protein [Cytobacillus sp. IB215665]MDX8364573.1 hypothetical protein [Cytobacillus sp. IB215665]